MKIIITILNYIDIGAPLLALLVFIRVLSQNKLAKELLYIFYFICIQLITNVTATVLEKLHITNYSVYLLNIVLSFLVLSILFYELGIPLIRKIFPFSSLLFLGFATYSISNGDGIETYNSIISASASFIITAYCLIFFYWRLVKDKNYSGSLTDSAFFWATIGVFTYYTGSFFIFISYKYLIVREAEVIGILWRFHNLLLTIFCIYSIYGLTCKNYQKT